MHQKLNGVISIAVADNIIIKRLSGRRSCPECNAVYHIEINAPKHDNLCNTCNIPLIQRIDDQQETVKKRLDTYRNQTEPLISFYKKKKLLYEVNGNQSIEKVFKDIVNVINHY